DCPVKAGMFSRGQTCRGRSQSPVLSRPIAGAASSQHRTRLGVRPAIGGNGMPRRAEEPRRRPGFSFDVERAVYLTVLHRLMVWGSGRHANDWCSRVRVPGAEGLDLDHAYEAMAWLGEVDAADRSTAEAVEEVATASRCSVPFRSRFSTPRHCGSKA